MRKKRNDRTDKEKKKENEQAREDMKWFRLHRSKERVNVDLELDKQRKQCD